MLNHGSKAYTLMVRQNLEYLTPVSTKYQLVSNLRSRSKTCYCSSAGGGSKLWLRFSDLALSCASVLMGETLHSA